MTANPTPVMTGGSRMRSPETPAIVIIIAKMIRTIAATVKMVFRVIFLSGYGLGL